MPREYIEKGMKNVRRSPSNGIRAAFEQLALAQASLVSNQAALVAQMSQTSREIAEARKETLDLRRESTERFQHIETILLHLVEVLPEAVRERIGIQKK